MRRDKHVAVLVLGELGRSPRMQYHCMSLSKTRDTQVSFIGYGGEKCTREVEENSCIEQIHLSTPFGGWPRRFWLLWAPLKVIFQIFQMIWVLLTIATPNAVLVQNPPSIPVLLVARIATWLRGSRLVIDWHNFGFSILSHSLGDNHPLVWVSYAYERWLGGLGDAHFCVTEAMRDWLAEHWGIEAQVLHDKAPAFFRRTSLEAKHELFSRLHAELCSGPGRDVLLAQVPVLEPKTSTFVTEPGRGKGKKRALQQRIDRPAILMSSTSWTPDEDFGILLDALVQVDDAISSEPTRYPTFLVLVTGKGPQKEFYQRRIAKLGLKRVVIRTLWLEAQDYPKLVGAADLGISLHVSTSGLDLPMKVVDMFGAGTPVCAVGFPCLGELVHHGSNGLVFLGAAELAVQILALFDGWPASSKRSGRVRPRELPSEGVSARCHRGASLCSREERLLAMDQAQKEAEAGDGASLLQLLAAGVERDREEDWEANWTKRAKPTFA